MSRAYELRATGVTFDQAASVFLRAAVPAAVINIIANEPEFESDLEVRGEDRFGHRVLTVSSTAVANGIAAICLAVRDLFGLVPHVYFDWTEGSPPPPRARRLTGQRDGPTEARSAARDSIPGSVSAARNRGSR